MTPAGVVATTTAPSRRPSGGGDGPPDLDEVWRDFNNRIGSLFGRKGGGNNRPGNRGGMRRPRRIGLGVIALVAIGVWAASGFIGRPGRGSDPVRQIQEHMQAAASRAMKTVNACRRLRSKSVSAAAQQGAAEALMRRTRTSSICSSSFSTACAPTARLFMTRDPDESVRQASETAMREIVGKADHGLRAVRRPDHRGQSGFRR